MIVRYENCGLPVMHFHQHPSCLLLVSLFPSLPLSYGSGVRSRASGDYHADSRRHLASQAKGGPFPCYNLSLTAALSVVAVSGHSYAQ